ncbi:MAG: hypothetical protein M5U31_10015 [Acidimicrobiia bacterium]|nr:hypothetical protein [Acidimicrobiia bacterium]
MPHALNLSVRRVGAGVVAVAVVLAGAIVLEASPAAAAGAYEGSRSPLSYGGTDYVDTGAGNGVLYYDGTNDATVVVDNDFEELDIVDGTDDVHVALVSSGGLNMTMYLTAAAFDDAPGGPVTPNCANVDALYFGGGPACVAFKTSIQRANGNGYDYQFDGFYGFVDASDNPLFGEPTVTPGYVDPRRSATPSAPSTTGRPPRLPSTAPTTTPVRTLPAREHIGGRWTATTARRGSRAATPPSPASRAWIPAESHPCTPSWSTSTTRRRPSTSRTRSSASSTR